MSEGRSETVLVLSGAPEQRPAGFPCFGCGAQVNEERLVAVRWPDGRSTVECICASCSGGPDE